MFPQGDGFEEEDNNTEEVRMCMDKSSLFATLAIQHHCMVVEC